MLEFFFLEKLLLKGNKESHAYSPTIQETEAREHWNSIGYNEPNVGYMFQKNQKQTKMDRKTETNTNFRTSPKRQKVIWETHFKQ